MQIPPECSQWESLLRADNTKGTKILANIQRENCISQQIAGDFFTKLNALGQPNDFREAIEKAEKVIINNALVFTCLGREIEQQIFVRLIRLEDLSSLVWRIPDVIAEKGLTDEDIKTLPEKRLLSLTDEYKGSVDLGGKFKIVWVSDADQVSDYSDLRTLIDRWALPNLLNEKFCVICIYRRENATELHLPRFFDGLIYEMFLLEPNCDAPYGKTQPLTMPKEQGLPESVHRRCEVIPEKWILGRIQ